MGSAGPNVIGRDTFVLYFADATGFVADGVPGTDDYDTTWSMCNPSSASNNAFLGASCGGRILLEGGMKY